MVKSLKNAKYFLLLSAIYLIVGFIILSIIEKGELEILLNQHHNPFLDVFFRTATFMGEGIFETIIILFLFFIKRYYGIVAGTSLILTTIVTQSLKRLVFADTLRPKAFFEGLKDLYYIEGLEIHSHFSFPSGHTSGAFTIFLVLALITRNPLSGILFFILAFLTGISRMYLLQHFFIDTYFGTLIAIVLTLIIFFLFEKSSLSKREDLQRPVKIFKNRSNING
ncbi:MAG TPA: phosphatase PAP2 family protein [Cytophagaceae bacterium]